MPSLLSMFFCWILSLIYESFIHTVIMQYIPNSHQQNSIQLPYPSPYERHLNPSLRRSSHHPKTPMSLPDTLPGENSQILFLCEAPTLASKTRSTSDPTPCRSYPLREIFGENIRSLSRGARTSKDTTKSSVSVLQTGAPFFSVPLHPPTPNPRLRPKKRRGAATLDSARV